VKLTSINTSQQSRPNKPSFGMEFDKRTVKYLAKVASGSLDGSEEGFSQIKLGITKLYSLKNNHDGLKVKIKNLENTFTFSSIDPMIYAKDKTTKGFVNIGGILDSFGELVDYLGSPKFTEETTKAIAERKRIETSNFKDRMTNTFRNADLKLSCIHDKFFDSTLLSDFVFYKKLTSNPQYKAQSKELKIITNNLLLDKKS